MKLTIAIAIALLAAGPAMAVTGEIPGTPECDAAAERYANMRSPWKYSSQWFYYYTEYENNGCTGVGD